ncbi:MmyB family transcriptional regulator [Siccibacter turicensis]|uniref:MmyB family transcriptional regulator n=1 Tax=Siccibacter turicensis TaxID=357233 RepID=UPI003F67C510
MFTDAFLQARVVNWDEQAPLMLSSFRCDFARASQSTDIPDLVNKLERVSPEFKLWWRQHQVHAPCNGVRHLLIDEQPVPYEFTSLTVDEDRHLRLVVYARQKEQSGHHE